MQQPDSDEELEPVQTYLPASLKRKLERVSAKEDRPVAAYVRRLIAEHLKGVK